ncbi:carbohydrate kinase family protein [Rhodococcus sp. WS3]|uniref:carbohydrate kinase family protein n=1 Tax=unclassified Rhodococcus (in: high G+C Gram-positive bacteria) TaxID=192944 RepID=UPI0005D39943|nr:MULTISPECIES: carbohydrate kinase family protein [unclassified Rhodococcus (in: high G+C Gram-positive bacteria)]KJF19298.1 Fructosamine kinase frlD [Rhodococcus sp. AD45]ROZ42746.1 carbohydrate kinase family protein [Rhodococcus sp. WS3]RZL21767.1 MAG: carbohydrate kinase family protein [Rhodococcus sp. (in: high G+C Gram-positive bacteria)]
MNPQRALFVGDISWDTTVVVPHLPGPDEKVVASSLVENVGGVTTNAAIACSRAGTLVTLTTTVGADMAGSSALSAVESTGVILTATTVPNRATCRAIITLDSAGEKRLVLAPNAAMYPALSQLNRMNVAGSAWMHTALYDLDAAAVAIDRARIASVPWSIDLEPATIPAYLDELEPHLRGCTTVFANSRTGRRLGDSMVGDLLRLGVHEVVETLGPHGAVLTTSDRVTPVTPPKSIGPVLDTTGAGDALAGWFVSDRVEGKSAVDALRTAVDAASYTVQFHGASSSYPTRCTLTAHHVRLQRERFST